MGHFKHIRLLQNVRDYYEINNKPMDFESMIFVLFSKISMLHSMSKIINVIYILNKHHISHRFLA